VALFCCAASTAWAADAVEMEGTTIRGATELPKVLYIVPWKKADLGDVSIQPGDDVFNEELVPLDRDIFRRQVLFYDQLQGGASAAAPEQAPASSRRRRR
jgi:hypothetical protein